MSSRGKGGVSVRDLLESALKQQGGPGGLGAALKAAIQASSARASSSRPNTSHSRVGVCRSRSVWCARPDSELRCT